jgi:hypothetical protein
MGLFSLAELFGITIRESANDGSDFTNPSADFRRLFLGEDNALHTRDSSGVVRPTFPGNYSCFVYNSGLQGFGATTLTTITFDSEVWDDAAFHDTGSNTGRLVAPVTGRYRVSAGIWYATTSGTNYILFDKNGAGAFIRGGATAQNGGGSGMYLSTITALTAADYITVVGYHTQAGSINTGDSGSTPSQQNWAAMELIGV